MLVYQEMILRQKAVLLPTVHVCSALVLTYVAMKSVIMSDTETNAAIKQIQCSV